MAPTQLRVTILAFYAIFITSVGALPYNIIEDFYSRDPFGLTIELIFLLLSLSGFLSLMLKRDLRTTRVFFTAAIAVLLSGLIITAGGFRGIGLFYVIACYSILYYILGLHGGIFVPALTFIGILIRLNLGGYAASSIFNQSDIRVNFLIMAAVAAVLGIFSVICQHLVLRSLHRAAYIDDTTGLDSRYYIEQAVEERIKHHQVMNRSFSLIGLKINGFATVSSVHGNRFADQVLGILGTRLREVIRQPDRVGRYSGTVFLIITDQTEFIDLEQTGKRLLAIGQESITLAGRTIALNCLVTITRYPHDGTEHEFLIANLIAGFNRMRHRNGILSFYDETLHRVETDRYTMIDELRQAVAAKEFHLVYHPKVCLTDGSINGAEVLLRWESRLLGSISPVVFIPLAEEAGLIQEISRWVVQTALEEISKLNVGEHTLVHAINLSPKNLADSDFRKFLWDTLRSGIIKSGLIEFEITEGTMMDENPAIQRTLELIRESGCKLAIDDFGTGYSSLSYLHRLQAGNLKIDRSFISQLCEAKPFSPVVDAIVSMALSLKMEVTAEGVETPFQEAYLRERNCTYGQGWLYSKPVQLGEYRILIEKNRNRPGRRDDPEDAR